MIYQNDYAFAYEIEEKGLSAIPALMRVLINNAMQVERSKHLQADQYDEQKIAKVMPTVSNLRL